MRVLTSRCAERVSAKSNTATIATLLTRVIISKRLVVVDEISTPVGVQQKLMRHTDVRTTMRYGDAFTSDMAVAHGKVVALALNGAQTERKPS